MAKEENYYPHWMGNSISLHVQHKFFISLIMASHSPCRETVQMCCLGTQKLGVSKVVLHSSIVPIIDFACAPSKNVTYV